MQQTTQTPDSRLIRARDHVAAEITRTDTKATALLTAFGIPFAVLVATVPGRDFPTAAAVLAGAGTVGLVAALLTVLLALRPRLGGTTRGSYLHWAQCTPEDITEDLATDRNAEHIVQLSQAAVQKYKALRRAIDLTAAALCVLALALLVALI